MTERLPGSPQTPEFFRLYREEAAGYSKAQFEYGKWLITTLITIHAGSLFVVGSSDAARRLLSGPLLALLVLGIFLSLLAGFLTWTNWSLHRQRNEALAWDQLTNVPSLPSDYMQRPINITFIASVVCGLLSGFIIPAAAIVVWSTILQNGDSAGGWEFTFSTRKLF